MNKVTVLLSTMRLHHYEKEAIVDRHVTGAAGTGKFQSMLGNVVFNDVACL